MGVSGTLQAVKKNRRQTMHLFSSVPMKCKDCAYGSREFPEIRGGFGGVTSLSGSLKKNFWGTATTDNEAATHHFT